MKKTPIFEELFPELLKLPKFWQKLLIGSLLSFVPILNFFAFGYLYRVSVRVRQSGQVSLPEWEDWPLLFVDGIKFGLIWFFYWLLPLLLVSLVMVLMWFVGLGILMKLLGGLVFLLSTALFNSALYRYNMRQNFRDVLDVRLLFRMTGIGLSKAIIGALVFLGLFTCFMPFYGFVFFSGFLLVVIQSSLHYRAIEMSHPASL